MFIEILSYIGVVVGLVFITLSIAAGLYYVSEIVEEHTEPTKRSLQRIIYVIGVIFLLLWIFDGFPFKLTCFSIISYYIYLQNLNRFPYVELTSPIFLVSCVLVIANHFLWFDHFHNPYIPPLEVRLQPNYVPPRIPSFVEVCSFFGLCVWFIPFALFVSLSAHENLLPHHIDTSSKDKKKTTGLAKVVVGNARDWLYNIARKFGVELDPDHDRIV